VHVTLAEGAGKNLVEGGCQLCHGLDRVTATPRSHEQWQLIVNRMVFVGSPLEQNQIGEVVSYLSTHYGAPKQTASAK
jgi:mono/diheme cytochrome c family protein